MSPLARIFHTLISIYRVTLALLIPGQCRYLPTCSEYGLEAVKRHGAITGGWLTIKRVSRCHPWAGHGLDPVPLNPNSSNSSHPCHHHADGRCSDDRHPSI